jgi:hypothetical protein
MRGVCRIPQGGSEFGDGDIDGMVKITGVLVGPNPAPQFLSRYDFTRVLQQSVKNLKWLLLEFDPYACFA